MIIYITLILDRFDIAMEVFTSVAESQEHLRIFLCFLKSLIRFDVLLLFFIDFLFLIPLIRL